MTTKQGAGRAALALFLAIAGTACGEDPLGPDVPVPTTLNITPSPVSLVSLGQQIQLTPEVLDQNGNAMSGLEITYVSSNTTVVVHETGGRFRAVGNGTAVVTVRAGGDEGVSGTVDVTVAQVTASISLARAETTLWAVGQSEQWTARAFDALGTELETAPTFTWTSGANAIATVSNTGLVTAVADGTTNVRAAVGTVNNGLPITVSATVPYELCVNLTLGPGPGTEVCTTLSITVHQ